MKKIIATLTGIFSAASLTQAAEQTGLRLTATAGSAEDLFGNLETEKKEVVAAPTRRRDFSKMLDSKVLPNEVLLQLTPTQQIQLESATGRKTPFLKIEVGQEAFMANVPN